MTISIQDVANRFGISNPETLQMFVKWIQLSPNQKYAQKSEQMEAPCGFQLDAGQFAYVTLKSVSGMPWYFIIISLSNFQALSFLMTRFGGFKETWLHTFSLNCVVCQLHQLHKGKRRIQRS